MRSLLASAALACALVGCSTQEPAAPSRTPVAAKTTAPPNTVMLDYRESDKRPLPPEVEPQAEVHPRIRQTIVIGRANPDQAYEQEGAPPSASEPQTSAASSGGLYDNYTFYQSYGAYRSGSGGATSSGGYGSGGAHVVANPSPSRGTPKVGGDWPRAQSFGPGQVHSRVTP